MKKLRKMLAVLLAVSAIGGGVSIPVSAEELIPMEEEITTLSSYDPCDIDRDGVVSISDALKLQQYLLGILSEPNYNLLDANRNLIVDDADVQCIMAKLVDSYYNRYYVSRKTSTPYITPPTIINATLDSYASATDARYYRKYNCNTHATEIYPLDVSSTALTTQNGDSTNSMIDMIDTRTQATGAENTGLVLINGNRTGFIVGDHEIATAASVVLNNNGSFKSNVTVQTYNASGTATSTTLTPVELHVPRDYSYSGAEELDYALITVEEDLSNYVHFALGNSYNVSVYPQNQFDKVPLYITGCNNTTEKKLYFDEGRILSNVIENGTVIHTDTFSKATQYGSPIYTVTLNVVDLNMTYTYTALGILSGATEEQYSSGSRITKYHQKFYLNNSHASHGENTQ